MDRRGIRLLGRRSAGRNAACRRSGLAGTRERTYLRTADGWSVGEGAAKITATQRAILESLDRAGRALTPPELVEASGKSLATIQALRKKGLIVADTEGDEPQRRSAKDVARTQPLNLNDDQAKALARILDAAEERRPETFVLLGVTGSGKTEVYIRAIEEVIQLRPAGDRAGAGDQPDAADAVSGSSRDSTASPCCTAT